jgi:conjugal transfer/type IV secretion protein DotA/TraY
MFGLILSEITKGQVLRYMFMPQIMPRLYALAGSGFTNLAFMIALVYRSLRLLPTESPLFLSENRSSLTLRSVIGEAAGNLKFNWANADKIIVFGSILVGLVILALQFASLVGYLMINPALANMPENYGDFFAVPTEKDIAYLMLFTVFGVAELFKPGADRTDFHEALHGLFQFYSLGLLVIAVIIVCYFIFAIVVETAQTGVPFGKRYNHVWTPIRLVFALGLLIPIGYGLNAAQWITLYSAKLGSDFATKGWVTFNETMNQSFLDEAERVGVPKAPNVKPLLGFMATALACEHAHRTLNPQGSNVATLDIQAYVITGSTVTQTSAPPTLAGYKLPQTANDEPRRDILIRFGVYNETEYEKQIGKVFPFCGDLVLYHSSVKEEGTKYVQEAYLKLIADIWKGDYGIKENASNHLSVNIRHPRFSLDTPDMAYRGTSVDEVNKYIGDENEGVIKKAVEAMIKSDTWKNDMNSLRERGWGGAGIWYNKIAQLNGALVTAVANLPQARQMPYVMEQVKQEQIQQNQEIANPFSSNLAGTGEIQLAEEGRIIGSGLIAVYDSWAKDPNFGDLSNQTQITGNFFIDAINIIFGTQGLYAMCQNTDVHPLAQLSQLGKGLVEASTRNLLTGIGFSALAILPVPMIGPAGNAVSSILMAVAGMTIIMGFLLYYVLPFMPFLYFFFAVGGWIKGLFEAMVGVPLWALAFLRIDGEGLPGDAAMGGIYLIFEIFLRPIMIIFGLLASIVIFAAMVKILNEVFYLVVHNVAGHDPNSTAICGKSGGNTLSGTSASAPQGIDFFRGPIDEFFFTIMYAIIVYMIGMSCFKLIDLIPNNILRYMGASVNTFNDKASDPADGLMTRLSIGGKVVSDRIIGGGGILGNMTQAMQQGAAAGSESFNKASQ